MRHTKDNLINPRVSLHIFFWCHECGGRFTNYYNLDDWQQHQSDLEDAKDGYLICDDCAEKMDKELAEHIEPYTPTNFCPECGVPDGEHKFGCSSADYD